MSQLERIGISLERNLLAKFDKMISTQGYANRSEAIRDLIRNALSEKQLERPASRAVAGVLLLYDHRRADIPARLIDLQHDHLSETLASMHVHMDRHNCLEVIVIRGRMASIQRTADTLRSLTGVKLSRVNFITTGADP